MLLAALLNHESKPMVLEKKKKGNSGPYQEFRKKRVKTAKNEDRTDDTDTCADWQLSAFCCFQQYKGRNQPTGRCQVPFSKTIARKGHPSLWVLAVKKT